MLKALEQPVLEVQFSVPFWAVHRLRVCPNALEKLLGLAAAGVEITRYERSRRAPFQQLSKKGPERRGSALPERPGGGTAG
jgi:hypothetical protein